MKKLKYVIVGSGATGGAVGAFMTNAGKDVTFIARNKKLEAIKKDGIIIEKTDGSAFSADVKASSAENYEETPDIIFICVKYYSVQDIVPFLKKAASENTIVIPLTNVYATGAELQEKLDCLVTDGCIYISSGLVGLNKIKMYGDIVRVVFGRRDSVFDERLEQVKKDIDESGIIGDYSDDIKRDAFAKFIYVSSQAACGLYYDCPAGPIRKDKEKRECFHSLLSETEKLGEKMGIKFKTDEVQKDMDILFSLDEDASTSLQRDIKAGGKSEIDGLIYVVLREAEKYGADVPFHKMIAEELKRRYGG